MTARGPRTLDVGRIYDALLGGKDNFTEDRQAAERLIAAIPDIAAGARANREFPGRAVRFLAAQAGIRQFLDIGARLPAMGNSHTAAREAAPDARVAYVDIDPVVICHAQGLLGKILEVRAVLGDLRDPASILDHPDLRAHIDLRQPAAILLVAVLHFLPDQDAYPAVSYLKDAMAPETQQVYRAATAPRTGDSIARFFGGLEMVPPGAVRRRGLARRAGARAARPGSVLRRYREEAMTLTLMRAACPGQARAGARDGVHGSRAAGSSHQGRARRA